MGLETATYISGLVNTNPTASDPKNQGDDHLRLLKSTILTTFPNVTGAVNPTHTELNYVVGVTSAIQTQLNAKVATSGALGTPSSGTLTNCTGLPLATGVSGTVQATNMPALTGDITTSAGAVATTLATVNSNVGSFTNASITVNGKGLITAASNGAAATPVGLVLLATATPTAVATCDFTSSIDSTYEEYVFELINVLPATDGAYLYIRTSANAGSSFDSGASNYIDATAAAAQITATNSGVSNAAARGGVCGVARLFDPSATASAKVITLAISNADSASATVIGFRSVAGRRDATAAVNGIRFLFDSGNIASGKIKMYGLRKTV